MTAGLALALSVATYALTGNNTFTAPGLIAWVLSVALWLAALAQPPPDTRLAAWRGWLARLPARVQGARPGVRSLVVLLVILGVAAFFRLYRLAAIPDEMTSDHVEKILDARDVATGHFHVFFPHNGGREAFQFYLVPVVAWLFGTGFGFVTLKLATALEALALVLLMVRLGHRVVDRETGLLAAALLAISWWHTLLGRLGLRGVLTPLVFSLLLVDLVQGIRTGERRAWLWAGVWLGCGVYAYQALRLAPAVAILAFAIAVAGPLARAAMARARRRDALALRPVAARTVSRQGRNLLCALLVALAIWVPMLRYWHDSPGELWRRVVTRATNQETAILGPPLQVLAGNVVGALGMFTVKGDRSWFASVPGAPVLDPVTGALLVLGVLAWLVRLAVRRDPADAFVLAAGLVMLLPSALALAFPIENPHTTRASGAIPVVFLLTAWPLALLLQVGRATLGRIPGSLVAGAVIALLLAVAAAANYQRYFVEYDQSYRGRAPNPAAIAGAVREVIGQDAPLDGVWVESWPFWQDHRAIGIAAGDPAFRNAIHDARVLEKMLGEHPEWFVSRPLVFVVHPRDAAALALLAERFPRGQPRHHPGPIERQLRAVRRAAGVEAVAEPTRVQ
jgi:hypothetical protein